MNRQQRRQMSRQGEGPEVTTSLQPPAEPDIDAPEAPGTASDRIAREALAPTRHRLAPRQFLHEVNSELRKVVWPSSAETINYSTVVLITLAILMAMIFGLDLLFTRFSSFLFNP